MDYALLVWPQILIFAAKVRPLRHFGYFTFEDSLISNPTDLYCGMESSL